MNHIKKEIDYFHIENGLGWNQNWFSDRSMYDGGCGAVTACDLCIHLAKQKGLTALYPYNILNLNKKDYLRFSNVMKPYLHPCWQGIDTLERYLAGLRTYFHHTGINILKAEGLSGTLSWQKLPNKFKSRLTVIFLFHFSFFIIKTMHGKTFSGIGST